MRRLVFVALAVCTGMPAGFLARSIYESGQSRADAAFRIFTTHCLAHEARNTFEPPDHFVEHPIGPNETLYVDAKSKLDLKLDTRSCQVADTLKSLTEEEHFKLREKVEELVVTRFPNLVRDSSTGLEGPKNGFWFEYPASDSRRWGVSLITFDHSEPTYTLLSYYYRKQEE